MGSTQNISPHGMWHWGGTLTQALTVLSNVHTKSGEMGCDLVS